MSEWIPVDERLPDEGQLALFYRPNTEGTGIYPIFMRRWQLPFPFGEVTHWMPLPEPPQ